MSLDWADNTAQQLLSRDLIQTPLEVRAERPPVRRGDLLLTGQRGICLILGAGDTGKTTLAAALAKRLTKSRAVGIIDADIGQSHIGPPATVGWAVAGSPEVNFRVKTSLFSQTSGTFASCYGFSRLAVGGISFVGDVTPVGHLLQLTAAIVQCARQVSEAAELIIIDTPGFISGPAAAALWWTVQRILQPELILAVQRGDELSDILTGLQSLQMQLELIKSPPQIPVKSPQDRRRYRQSRFSKYFRDSCLYNISLGDIVVQRSRSLSRESLVHRLVALRDGKGVDMAIGLITDWQEGSNTVVVRAPQLDIRQIRCLVIGDVSIEIP